MSAPSIYENVHNEDIPNFLYEKGFIGSILSAAAAARDEMAFALHDLDLPAWGPGRIGLVSRLLDGPLSQVEIAQLLRISPPSAMDLVKRLERDGYVTRHRDSADRRRLLVSLTPYARTKVIQLRYRLTGDMTACEAGLAREGFTQADFDRCKHLLRRFSEFVHAGIASLATEAAKTSSSAPGHR